LYKCFRMPICKKKTLPTLPIFFWQNTTQKNVMRGCVRSEKWGSRFDQKNKDQGKKKHALERK
jgi:hypothetical protein